MDITVAGSGKATLAPERATVRLVVGFDGADLASVHSRTNELVQQVSSMVDELAGRTPSPVTWSAVLPTVTRSWVPYGQDGTPQPTQFGASAEVKVAFQDFVELARFVADAGGRTGIRVDGVEWTLTDETRRAREADVLTDAVSDARRRAEVVAKAAGAGEVRLVEIADPGLLGNGRGGEGGGGVGLRMMAASMGGAPEVRPEDVVIASTVHAHFEA